MTDLDAAVRAKLAGWLDDICGAWSNGCAVEDHDRAIRMRAAIVAVLDLHKPNPHPSGLGPYCEVCVGGYEGVSEWPCETVKDIAAALGIEAPSE